MTLGGVRAFFRTRLNALDYKEWTDGFNTANIPATVLDGAYHIEAGRMRITSMGAQHSAFQFVYPLTLRVLSKGFKNPAAAIDGALDYAQEILADVIPAARGVTQNGIKSLNPTGVETQPLQASNDNVVMLLMTFDVSLILAF